MIRATRLILLTLPCVPTTSTAQPAFQPSLLFMQPQDARDTVGILAYEANALQLRGAIKPPASTASGAAEEWSIGSFHPLTAVPAASGGYHVYACSHRETGSTPSTFHWRIYRGLTKDGYSLTDWKEVFRNPPGPWLIESMLVRQETTNNLFFFTWSRHPQPEKGFFSLKGLRLGIKAIQTVQRAHPKRSSPILVGDIHRPAAEAGGVIGVVLVHRDDARRSIQAVELAPVRRVGADPQDALAILINGGHRIATQSRRIVRVEHRH